MEAVQANLVSTCPLPFSGTTGTLFAGAITAVIAAHCAFYNGTQWPKDSATEIIERQSEPVSFDFIIVGAGTAGSLLANRLEKQFPSQSILLIEAGDDPGLDTEVPAFTFLTQKDDFDWHYKVQPDDKSCKGFKENRCIWNKGKGMGGSSSINAMLYIRGHPNDYENWANLGLEGWSYKDVSPYFVKIEKDFELSKYKYPENPWYGVLEATYTEMNLTQHKKTLNEALLGFRINKLLVKEGRRLNTGRFYLKDLKNVKVMKNTSVQKLKIDTTTKTITGVEIRHKSGVVMEIKSHKEVILSAGSIATPQLMMLSGIGPKKHLEEKQIKCLVDLPVGQNLQDHVLLPLFMKTNLDTVLTPVMFTSYLLQYMLTRSGPLSTLGVTDFMAFINTEKKNGQPNIQFLHTYYTAKESFMMRPFLEGYGYKEEIIKSIENINRLSDLLGIFSILLHPKSRGEVLLDDNNPGSKPIIKANYFQDVNDLATLMKSIEYVHKLKSTTVFKALGIELSKLDILECEDAEEYWECYVKYMASSLYHPVGTAKMGPEDDETAVVDQDLLVRGVKKLRVVDASVMPEIPGGNTMGPILMIADKAADIIKKQYQSYEGYKDEL